MTEPSLLDQSSETPPSPEGLIDPNQNYFDQLVGPGKKYKDQEALAKGNYHGDLHIQTLETRFDQLREDFIKERESNADRAKLEDLIKELKQQPPANTSEPAVREQPTIKPEDIKNLFNQSISEYERSKTSDSNLNVVKNKLIEQYGKNYHNAYKDKLESVGLTPERADTMAREAPQAVIKLLELDATPVRDFAPPPQTSGAFRPMSAKKTLRYSDYMEMRKKNPKLYYDPKINNEMERAAAEQGEAFFDVDV